MIERSIQRRLTHMKKKFVSLTLLATAYERTHFYHVHHWFIVTDDAGCLEETSHHSLIVTCITRLVGSIGRRTMINLLISINDNGIGGRRSRRVSIVYNRRRIRHRFAVPISIIIATRVPRRSFDVCLFVYPSLGEVVRPYSTINRTRPSSLPTYLLSTPMVVLYLISTSTSRAAMIINRPNLPATPWVWKVL